MNELKLLQTPVGIKVVPHIDAPFLSKLPAGVYSPNNARKNAGEGINKQEGALLPPV